MFNLSVKLVQKATKIGASRVTSNIAWRSNVLKNSRLVLFSTQSQQTLLTSPDYVRKLSSRVWSEIIQDLSAYANEYDSMEAGPRFINSLEYIVPKGKNILGIMVVMAYKMLANSEDLTEENLRLVQFLAWCFEIWKSFMMIVDDLLDGGETRHGLTCWYKLDGVGIKAANDAVIMEMCVYHLLKKYFGKKDYYNDLVDLFHQTTFVGSIGQTQDTVSISSAADCDLLNMKRYISTINNKTNETTFAAIALPMIMAGHKDPEIFRQAKAIQYKMGYMFQMQNDFFDCFGNSKFGKVGKDIENGTCTWLACKAMEKATDDQREIIRECYGRKDPEKAERVKKLYEVLKLPEEYEICLKEICKDIESQKVPGLPLKLFSTIKDRIDIDYSVRHLCS